MSNFSLGSWPILALSVLCIHGAEADKKIINSVEILGAPAAIPLESRAGDPLDKIKLEHDVKTLWRSGHYTDIRVEAIDEAAADRRAVRLVFRMKQKPLQLLRNVEINPPTPGIDLALEPRTPLDTLRAQQIATGVRKQLASSGFPDAKVTASLAPAGPELIDLHVDIDKGRSVKVKEVTFSGELGVKPSAALSALRATKRRTLLPGIPGVWKGWGLLPGYADDAVQSDIANLRSFYYKRGYFDANIGLGSVDMRTNGARVDFSVQSGTRYGIRQFNLMGADGSRQIALDPDGAFPVQKVCAALFAERRKAERAGVLDFTARIEVREAPDAPPGAGSLKWADLTATVQRGPAYRVGRIEFRGNRAFSDLTIRRMMLLNEAEPLDELLLRKTLARLNATGMFEPLTESGVVVNTPPGSDRADLTIVLKEKKARHWFLSGPVGPMNLAGPLQLAIGSRLPSWGQGLFELSTYTVSLNLLYFATPLSSVLSFLPNQRWIPELVIRRQALPGQPFLSGFVIAPQFGWQGMVAGYGASQAKELLGRFFHSDRAYTPMLPVTIVHKASDGSERIREDAMYCELPKTKGEWGRQIGGTAFNLLFSLMPF